MSIQVAWDERLEATICLQVIGHWTWDEFYRAMDSIHVMMDKSPYEKIDFILDIHEGNLFPQNMLGQMRQIGSNHHPKSGMMLVVGAGKFAQTLFNIMDKLLPNRMQYVRLVSNIDEAYYFLKSRQTIQAS